MITPSFLPTATERVLPKLALDFTTASLDPRITFTRADNTATRVNSSGYVETVNADMARFDYDPITLACKGLLIEEQRANLLTYSEQFNESAWTKSRASIVPDAITSPRGNLTGDKLVEDTTASSTHQAFQSFTTVSGTTYSFSVYAKAAERTQIALNLGSGAGAFSAAAQVIVNLNTGAIVSGSGTIAAAGNGWYRITVQNTAIANAVGDCIYRIAVAGGTIYTGDGTSGIYLWGAQLEAGAFPTSYIPTTTTSLTRNADVATMTGANFSSWFNASEGTLLVEADTLAPSTIAGIFSIDNASTSRIDLRLQSSAQRLSVVDTNVAQASITAAAAPSANVFFKLAGAYKVNDFVAASGGGNPIADTSGTVPTVTQCLIGSISGTANFLNGHIKYMRYYPQRLINAEVRAISK